VSKDSHSVGADTCDSVQESINSVGLSFTDVHKVSHIFETVVRESSTFFLNKSHNESEAVKVSWGWEDVVGSRHVSLDLFKDVVSFHSVSKFIL